MLRTIAEHLAGQGHQVDVLSAQPSYGGSDKHRTSPTTETIGDVKVRRARLLPEKPSQMVRRALNLGFFALQVFAQASRRGSYDVVMAATTPPILVALTARLASKVSGARFVYHMQDIYPEVLAANEGRPLGVPQQALQRVDSWTTQHADRVVVLSQDMMQTLADRHRIDHVRVINNFLPDASHSSDSKELETVTWVADSFQVVFAGNLGNFQGIDHVIEAFALLDESGVEAHLVLVGSGAAEEELRTQAATMLDRRVFFAGRMSQSNAEQIVSASDLALVTLNKGVIATAFPSKTMTYLSCGTPVLAAVEHDSELATLLRTENVGTSCQLDARSIATAIEEAAAAQPIETRAVEAVAASYASAASRLPEWAALFGELDD